jgi:hypothetical protein
VTDRFRVALSGDFKRADGTLTYPDFDLAPLRVARGVEMAFIDSVSPIRADQLKDFDALILLSHRFAPESVRRVAASASLPASALAMTPSTSTPAPRRASRSSSRPTACDGR